MQPTDKAAIGAQNEPKLPVAWTKTYKGARVFATTMGSSQDLLNEGSDELIVNATYWALGLEKKIAAKSRVDIVGMYEPHAFGFKGSIQGRKPQEF